MGHINNIGLQEEHQNTKNKNDAEQIMLKYNFIGMFLYGSLKR